MRQNACESYIWIPMKECLQHSSPTFAHVSAFCNQTPGNTEKESKGGCILNKSIIMNRRTFVKTTGALGALAAAGGITHHALFSSTAKQAQADTEESIVWTHCHVNCGGACVLQCHVKDGELLYVESDNTGDSTFGGFQARACLRGRSIRHWLNSPDRLNYPMKRVKGTKRGEGKYERITWDEALDTIASEFTRIKEKYGNEAIFIQECSGVEQNVMMNNPFFRLFNMLGGEITRYGNYSNAALNFGAVPFTYGKSWGARSYKTLKDNELVVLFGNAPNDTRMGGDGAGYDLNVAREKKHCRIICIDCRRSELATNQDVEWIPIFPGTDAALVAGLAHEMISQNLVDLDFLHTYCVGYDEETLPEGAPANSSYVAYIMGTGYDKVEKTPAWASKITKIPEARIVKLAHEIAEAKPCFITQGWGPQRHTNGDTAARSIMLLPQLVGQVGIPGTNSGLREGNSGFDLPTLPTGDNPITTQFPQFLWPEVIKDGPSLTATNAGIKGADALSTSIKMLINYGNNMMSNQNSDINYTTDILADESLCEFILQYDVNMSDSCNWADIILPDLTPQETYSLSAAGENNDAMGLWLGQPIGKPKFERREIYEVCGDLAKRLGVYDAYTENGMTREDWCHKLWDELRQVEPQIPTYDKAVAQGIYKQDMVVKDTTEAFIQDPAANPLKTATGKIQIYSPELAKYAATWKLPEGDVIMPIPAYVPGYDGPESTTDKYPLLISCFHSKVTTHSSYTNNEMIHKFAQFNMWINPVDADARGIASGDNVRVYSEQGEVRTIAKVTNRIIPGVVAIPEGQWHHADMQGDRIDYGSCINTLSSRHANPVSKATGSHSVIGQVEKVGGSKA